MTSIGMKIRNARKDAGLTQAELAKKTSLSRSYIGDIEKDRYNPSVATLRAIADATGVPVESILGNAVQKRIVSTSTYKIFCRIRISAGFWSPVVS